LALSSFSTNVMHLILSQGIGFGIGGCFAYTPTIGQPGSALMIIISSACHNESVV
jgi:hypothetical protein